MVKTASTPRVRANRERRRPDPAGVAAQFLRKELDRGPVVLSNLEAVARTEGLLGEGQRITHAKQFTRAKKALGIRSVRNGFGASGEWLWVLDKPDVPIADAASASRVPLNWIEGVAALHHRRHPIDVPPHRWRQFLADCSNFLTADENWAERAVTLGWDTLALFGCRSTRPLDHQGSAGLLWLINGGRLVELYRDWAVIERAEDRSRRVYHRRRPDVANVTLPWRGLRRRSSE
jgi:hypothetical protein